MANPRRSMRSLALSKRSVLLLLSAFVLYQATYQLQIAFHNPKILEHEGTEFQNAAIVFNLHSKYPTVPSTERPSRWLQTLLERDLKRLGSKAATISAKRAALAVKKGVLFPAAGNVYPDGLYYAEVHIGKPAKMFYLDMDTGSELTWLQCDAPCRSCGNGPNGLYKLGEARVVDCRNAICGKVQEGRSYECEEDLNGEWTQCDYEVQYADGSFTMGALVSDFISLFLSNGRKSDTEAIIGCGYDQSGAFAKNPILTDGVMGLSNSKASLPSQLAQKGIVKKVIGQCLGNNGGNHLFFGEALVPSSGMMWAPMMGSLHKYGHYQARLRRIWYGANELDVEGAVDEITFDSGASFTYFVPKLFDAVLSAVLGEAKRWGLVRELLDKTRTYCWSNNPLFQVSMLPDVLQYFKVISLDFGGRNILELRPEGYLITSKTGNVCLGILNSTDTGLEFINILGDISMQGYLIVYNNDRDEIGWIRKDCNNQPNRPSRST